MRPWKAILAALVIFLAGLASGVSVTRLYRAHARRPFPVQPPSPPPAQGLVQRAELLRRLTERLELTNDQRRRVNELVRNSQDRVRQLYEPVVPRAQFELRQLRQEIEATLNPAQRERFAAMIRSSRVTRAPGEPPIRPRPDERGERRREAEPPRQRAPAEPGLRPPGQDPSSKPAEPPPR